MRVMVMVLATPESEAGDYMPSEQELTEMGNFNEELVNAGKMEAGEGLHPSSAGAKVTWTGGKQAVTDGPFTEAKELVAGFWLWKVDSMEEAVELAKRIPNSSGRDGAVEIRPVFESEDFGEAMTPELLAQEERLRAQVEQQKQQ
ncbi:MAG: YciI family protein [Dehalococcoidia bacterium]|nr:YciI family protein [Dehalococcoidia bacterium]